MKHRGNIADRISGTLRLSVLHRLINAVDEMDISHRMLSLNLRAFERTTWSRAQSSPPSFAFSPSFTKL